MADTDIREYTAETIDVAQNLAQIRRRPTQYICSKNVDGQIHMIREILDNSIDEIMLRPEGGTIYICLFRDRVNNRYQIGILDNGRGIPSKALLDVTTIIGASGKASALSAYNASSGLFGAGAKVAAALSSRFRVISANYLEKVVGSIYLENSEVVNHVNEEVQLPSGVLTVFEPDLSFFTDGPVTMESGYLDLVSFCKQLNIFNAQVNFQFYLFDRRISEDFWVANVENARKIFEDFLFRKPKTIAYDTSAVPDKYAYLFELWKTNSNIVYQDNYTKISAMTADRLSFDIRLYFTKKSATGSPQFFISINNILLREKAENSATATFMNILRKHISENLEEPHYKRYVLEEYRFSTMLLALDIKFNNAEFSGTTKDNFSDEKFIKRFAKEVEELIENKNIPDYWKRLTDAVRPDIELRYAQTYDVAVKRSDDKKVFTELNFPGNYHECKSSENDKCELYIVEGTSAGNITSTRNNNFQAIYETRGKPVNAATNFNDRVANRNILLKDPVYQDLMKILNIGPNTTDMSKARYSKIIIATDADADGYHIRSIHLNNLYIINPLIIESGMVWLANPPLYSMEIGSKKRLFLRDRTALTDARIEFLYKPTLDFNIVTNDAEVKVSDYKLYREICYLVNHIGDQFDLVAKQLNIPLLILERLVLALDKLYPNIDFKALEHIFDTSDPNTDVRVRINEIGKFMVVSVNKTDYPIGLESIGETIVKHILPIIKKYRYNEYLFKVRSNHKNATIKEPTLMSMMMLYISMRQLDSLFTVRRYKGLGEMDSPDCYSTIMNPETRSLTHVENVGSPEMNFALLGKDTSERKILLTETGTLSNLFIKENVLKHN